MKVVLFRLGHAYRIAAILTLMAVFCVLRPIAVRADTVLWTVGNYGSVFSASSSETLTQVNYGSTITINYMTKGTDGYLYCLGVVNGLNGIWRINLSSGQMDSSWTVGNIGSNAQHNNMALQWGPDGKLYLTQSGTTYVTQVDPTTKSTAQLSLGGGSINTVTGGTAFDQSGAYAYVAQLVGNAYHVYKYSLSNWAMVSGFDIVEPVNGNSQILYALVGGGDGYLYVSNYYRSGDGGTTIYRFNQSSGAWDSTWTAFTAAGGTVTRVRNLGWCGAGGLATIYATTNTAKVLSADASQIGTGQVMTTFVTLATPNTTVPGLAMNTSPSAPFVTLFDANGYCAGQSYTAAQTYDAYLAMSCLQGLANRSGPNLFIRFYSSGEGGGDYNLLNHMTESGGPCAGCSFYDCASMNAVIMQYRSLINGVVLFESDETQSDRSTSLAAVTAAACLGAIPVRKDTTTGSMYNTLVNTYHLPVLVDLTRKFTGTGTIWGTNVPSTGSAKCDAYIWAKVNYLDTGFCDPTGMMYTLDMWQYQNTELPNLDYAVKRKLFCADLSVWGDEKPNDDPTQPLGTDLSTLTTILGGLNARNSDSKIIRFCGAPCWNVKYTNYGSVGGSHTPLATERCIGNIMASYNCLFDSDAVGPQTLANASFCAALMPAWLQAHRYVQNPFPTYVNMQSRGLINSDGTVPSQNYVMLALGDYDGASWAAYKLANGSTFDDANRGQVYCNWALDPNLSDRTFSAFDYMYRHKSARDSFMAWDCGAGAVHVDQLYPRSDNGNNRNGTGYPSIIPAWQEYCKDWYRKWNYTITGWILSGCQNPDPQAPGNTLNTTDIDNAAPFSPNGLGVDTNWGLCTIGQQVRDYIGCSEMTDDLSISGRSISDGSGRNFLWYRTANQTPTQILALQNATYNYPHVFLDAPTWYYLLRYSLSGNQQSANYYRCTWSGDTIPTVMAPGHTYSITVQVRNDGWDTWGNSGTNKYDLGYCFVAQGVVPTSTNFNPYPRPQLTGSVVPGQTTTMTFNIAAPTSSGTYDMHLDMVQEGVTWFVSTNNIDWKTTITVCPGIVSGTVKLQDYIADSTQVPVNIEIRNTGGSIIETHTVSLDSAGNYSFNVTSTGLSGSYSAVAKASHWLAKAMPLTLDSNSSGRVSFSLLNGDINGDNVVEDQDYSLLGKAWYSAVGDYNYDSRADLNGDGFVEDQDYSILGVAWYQSGDDF